MTSLVDMIATNWWLPPNFSRHGVSIDSLFTWIFWITLVVFLFVQAALLLFVIRYRRRAGQRAHFTHGNTKVEMAWTIIPAIILAVLSIASKRVWDDFRHTPDSRDPGKATILVIAQQFQWNVVYPGPDGKLGRYLMFPNPTDTTWPGGKMFANVTGPAELPYEQAVDAINRYIDQEDPLGKDFDDPAGKDDDWSKLPGRAIHIPADRPVEVHLTSKDVIHSFFLPDFRVKLDAVPGMRGKVTFTATTTSKQREEQSTRQMTLDEVARELAASPDSPLSIRVNEASPGASLFKQGRNQFWRYVGADQKTIARDGTALKPEAVSKLREIGVASVIAYRQGNWELACAELCGLGHSRMRGTLIVLDPGEYAEKFEKKTAR